jgi:hypothetical protein
MDQGNLTVQLAMQCAPLLSGVKISNLLVTSVDKEGLVKRLFQSSPFQAKVICKKEQKVIFLIYQKDQLKDYISGEKEAEMMRALGYEQTEVEDILLEFAQRFQSYMEQRGEFPHEMGLLLEYPIEDVIGFIHNQGKNSMYTGYWKVYGNLQQALKRFEQYKQAKEQMLRMVASGVSMERIVKRHQVQITA